MLLRLLLLGSLIIPTAALAQNVRYDAQFPSINSQTAQPFLVANVPPNSPTLSVCHSPANQVPCTNFVTTFTGSGSACPNGAQDTPQPATTSACQTTGDAQGNIGFWAPSGTYDYTVCISTTCFGPFTVTLNLSTGGGGNPASPTGSLQTNNSGVFGSISPVAVGSAIVSNLAGTGFTPQTKYLIDARDIGVDCTYTNDSAAALNTLTNNQSGFGGTFTGATLVFPPGCHVKLLTSNWKITNQSSFTIRGASRGAAPFSNTSTVISYCANSAIVPVIDMESTFGGEVSNITVETKGTGCSTGTNVGIVVDKANATSTVNSTDNFIHDVTITTNMGGGAGPSGWAGLSVSPVSVSNVEDTRLWNSRINCNNSTNGVGVVLSLGGSFNAKLEEFKHNQISACSIGYAQNDGNWSIEGADTGGNGTDIVMSPGSDPSLTTNIVSESNQMISGGGGNWPNTIIASHVGWNGSSSSNLCGVDLGSATNGGNYVLIGNGSDVVPNNATNAVPLCYNTTGYALDIDGQWSSTQFGAPDSFSILQNFVLNKAIGGSFGSINGGTFRATNAAPSSSQTNQNIGYGFYAHSGMEMLGLSFNSNNNQDCVGGGRPCIGTDNIFLGNAGIIEGGMWPIPQYYETCVYTGTPGTTHWPTNILAIDAAGKRAGVFPFGGNWGCVNAASTLSVSNFLTVTWPRVRGAVSYAIILMNPTNNVQGELSATVADAGSGLTQSTTITSGSTGDSFSYVWPNFFEAATTTIQGELLTVAAPLTVSNPVAATNVLSQSSPILSLAGNYWNGSASALDSWSEQDVIANGTNGTSVLTFTHAGTSGASSINVPAFSIGASQAATGFQGTAGTKLATASGAFTNGHFLSANATGDVVDSGQSPAAGTTVYSTASAAGTGPIGTTTMVTAGGSGNFYSVMFYVDQTAAGIGCTGTYTLTVNVIYTDPAASLTTTANATFYSVTNNTFGTFTITNNGTVGTNYPSAVMPIRAKASTTVSYSTTTTNGGSCSTLPSYQVYPIVTLLN